MTEKNNKPSEDDAVAALFGDAPAAQDASILTDEDIVAAKKVAAENVHKALRDAELKRIVAEEEDRLRKVEGQRTGKADMDETVKVFIDLAEFSDRITLSFTDYFHGHSYDVPRHVANSLREVMQRTHRHQMEIDGKSLDEMYRRTAPVALSPGGPRPLPEGIAA